MSLLVDLFGYLGILLHGLVIVSQSMALGGMLFLIFLARPFAAAIGPDIAARTARIAAISALCLVAVEAVNVVMQMAILTSTLDVPVSDIITANFAVSGIIKAVAARRRRCAAAGGGHRGIGGRDTDDSCRGAAVG